MPIVIKEIRVSTVVEKRIVREHEISEDIYKRIKEDVLEELEERKTNFSSLLLADKIRECGGIWIDCSDSDLFSYDASHLDAESAVKLSQSIAETILKYLH